MKRVTPGLLALILAACGPAPAATRVAPAAKASAAPATASPTTAPAAPVLFSGQLSIPPLALIANGTTGLPDAAMLAGGGLVTDNGSALVAGNGLITDNGSVLLSEGGAGLVSERGSSFGLLDVQQQPAAGIGVALVDASGGRLTDETARTDADGRFAFRKAPAAPRPWFARADFQGAGQAFTFGALVPPDAATPIALDAPATLVVAKLQALLADGDLAPADLAPADVAALTAALRAGLVDQELPFMARSSGDLAATVDQLVSDVPAIAQAAGAAAAPTRPWRVSTLLDKPAMQALGLARGLNARFEVDADGNLYFFATDAPGLRILKRTPDGATALYASFDPGASNVSLLMGFGPDGTLYASYFDRTAREAPAFRKEGGRMVRIGTLVDEAVLGGLAFEDQGFGGRLAVDAAGTLYAALTTAQVVVSLPKGAAKPVVRAGKAGQAGYQDGAAALLSTPRSVAVGPDGALYVADDGNHCVRRIGADGVASTYAGLPGSDPDRAGRGKAARFGSLNSVLFAPSGELYVAGRALVRRLSVTGSAFGVAGSGRAKIQDGVGANAGFNDARFMVMDGAGNLYVRDSQRDAAGNVSDDRIRKLTPARPRVPSK